MIERKETVFSSCVMSWYRPFKFDSIFDTEKRKRKAVRTKNTQLCVPSIVRANEKKGKKTRERVYYVFFSCIFLMYFFLCFLMFFLIWRPLTPRDVAPQGLTLRCLWGVLPLYCCFTLFTVVLLLLYLETLLLRDRLQGVCRVRCLTSRLSTCHLFLVSHC